MRSVHALSRADNYRVLAVEAAVGSGTMVSGTAADMATEAALAAYPGGVVDNQDFTVVGAN